MTSLIPNTAHEVIHETWDTGAKKSAYYYLDGQPIGYRSWIHSGSIDMEYRIKDGKRHGSFRIWHENGQLCEEAQYDKGKEHGTTKQYDDTGTLIGTYSMDHGTGIDLWFERSGIVSEERHCKDGLRHGYERWWNGDNTSVWQEGHYWHGAAHGISRHWNQQGRLCRGYPQYFVAGRRVSKRQYERACHSDATLPPFVTSENRPIRQLPEAVRTHVEKTKDIHTAL